MYFISRWICTHNSKSMFVKIVYPGGHVEVHDQPIPAADLLKRNPKCCVARPTVFQEPYEVIPPNTTLALGQKYYVVPIVTVRRLQLKHSASHKSGKRDGDDDHKKMGKSSSCLLMRNRKNDCRVENGVKVGGEEITAGVGIGGKRALSVASFDHWKPGLESIME